MFKQQASNQQKKRLETVEKPVIRSRLRQFLQSNTAMAIIGVAFAITMPIVMCCIGYVLHQL